MSDTRYTVASDPAVEPADGIALYAPPGGDLVQLGHGDEVSIVGGGRVGQPPLDHLTTWRMILAQRMLRTGERVAAVAEAVGYHSQSAFTQAFKRTLGHTPRSMK